MECRPDVGGDQRKRYSDRSSIHSHARQRHFGEHPSIAGDSNGNRERRRTRVCLPAVGVFGVTESYKRVNYTDIEPVSGAMRPLTDSLDSQQVGVSIARCEPGWRSKPHDHAADDHEEIYVLLEGEATVVIDDESVELETGDAVWISPTATRQIRNGDVESAFVLVSAPASQCRTATCADEPGSWATNGFIG